MDKHTAMLIGDAIANESNAEDIKDAILALSDPQRQAAIGALLQGLQFATSEAERNWNAAEHNPDYEAHYSSRGEARNDFMRNPGKD